MNRKIGKEMKKVSIILFLIFLTLPVLAAVTAQVDRNQVVIGESFNLIITVDENTSEQPDLSELHEVFTVLGTSQSSSTKIINGTYSVEKSWQVGLIPKSIGENTIPPIKLGSSSTQPINISVTKSDNNTKANGDIFIEVEADKTSAFVKEQIILTVKLYYAISLSEGNLSEPNLSSAIVTQLDKGATYTTTLKGKNYTVIERHYALFAEKSGTYDMNPIIFNGRDNSSRRSFSMFSTGKPVRAVSTPLTFEIKPIPQQSIGKSWIPAKKVQISQDWSEQPYTVGEPITRTITLYIEGLSETQIPEIDLGEIENVRVYPEQPQTQTEKTPQTVKSWKQVKLALIPTRSGAIRIPEYQLQWYNTETDTIEYAKLPPMTIKVGAGEFSMEKPNIADIMDDKTDQAASKTGPVTSAQSVTDVKVVEKDSMIWKALTALFAILWLSTMVLYLRKNHVVKSVKNTSKKITVSKSELIAAIKSHSPDLLQQRLIIWWNQQYPSQNVINLDQIKPQVNNSMKMLIDQLDTKLYSADADCQIDYQQWLKQVNAKGLKIVKNAQTDLSEKALPSLY